MGAQRANWYNGWRETERETERERERAACLIEGKRERDRKDR